MRIGLAAAIGAACAALPALADPSSRNETDMGATVASVCNLGNVSVSGGQNASFNANDLGGTIALSALADRNTAHALPASISITFDSVCNQTVFLRLVSTKGGLKPQQGTRGGGGFVDRVDYTASLDFGVGSTSLSTDGSAGAAAGVSLGGAQSGPVTLNIEIPAGTEPLVAGAYTDELMVKFDGKL